MATQGGKRKGAGRKPSAEKKAASIVKAVVDMRLAALPSMSPLEVILECMNGARDSGDQKAAAMFANMAAPYIHPKLSSVTSNNTHSGNLTLLTEFPE